MTEITMCLEQRQELYQCFENHESVQLKPLVD